MEMVEIIEWLTLGFISTLTFLDISYRMENVVGKRRGDVTAAQYQPQ